MAARLSHASLLAAIALICSVLSCACASNDSKRAGKLQVTASAEGLGANGYAFPPNAGQEVAFVDGWAVNFERIIVAIGNIRISETPDKNPGDQSVTGADVALRRGPFVLDLKRPGDAPDKGGAGEVAIRLPIEDLEGIFDLEQRYSFSFDLVEATADATFVNVDADDVDVLAMVASGQRALLKGTAEFKGQTCHSSDTTYDFDALPKAIGFEFGLEGAVSYVNCQNPENLGAPIEGEESQRGIQMLPTGVTSAQITVHTDHLFWPTVSHENLPLFNQFAANAALANGTYSVNLEMLRTVPVPNVTDASGSAVPWRSCVDSSMYVLPAQTPAMTFDPGTQPLVNLHDFVQFNAATMGHLNADGLCFVEGYAHSHGN